MSAVAVVNVRMGSTRLPGKTLREVCGRPLLGHLIDRLRRATCIDRIVVATSVLPANDAIASFCEAEQVHCFRGPEEDVLARTLGALQSADARTGVLVFGDGPVIDPAIIDSIASVYGTSRQYDFVSNDLSTTYPPGMEVEVFSVAALADAAGRCEEASIREHGTLFIRRNPQLYRLHNVEAPLHLRRPELELEIDTEEDLQVISAVLEHFGADPHFTLADIIGFMDTHPQIAAINRSVARRWKAFRAEG